MKPAMTADERCALYLSLEKRYSGFGLRAMPVP
jgi:hypothetical protein